MYSKRRTSFNFRIIFQFKYFAPAPRHFDQDGLGPLGIEAHLQYSNEDKRAMSPARGACHYLVWTRLNTTSPVEPAKSKRTNLEHNRAARGERDGGLLHAGTAAGDEIFFSRFPAVIHAYARADSTAEPLL